MSNTSDRLVKHILGGQNVKAKEDLDKAIREKIHTRMKKILSEKKS